MIHKAILLIILGLSLYASTAIASTKVSIAQTIAACKTAGIKPSGTPIQSKLKQETSLVGMAYLNYIYQNDLENPHFCQSMMLMNSQVPSGTVNPYIHLFDSGRGEKTIKILQDIQLCFDYSIARTSPSETKLQTSLGNVKSVLRALDKKH